jgi:2-polyprenyl-3-methyl-5-hydroxy-6-metoxy-1,4-benzoquinol methylase
MKNPEPIYKGRTKYTQTAARNYQRVKPGKHRAEMQLVERAFSTIPKGMVLDAPCGGGRVSLLLAGLGYQVTSADLSEPMLEIARENFSSAGLNIPVLQEDVEKLTFADCSFDAVISFRLFHHFPTAEIRQRVVKELCRVSRGYVALSYFSPYSFTSLRQQWRSATGGRSSAKHATSLREVNRYFETCGFVLYRDFARLPFIHTLHLAVFYRSTS